MRIVPLGLAAALLMVTLFAFSSPATTRAQEDACGVMGFDIPDSGANFDFTEACAAHDDCYTTFHGQGETARKACDDQFLADMQESCAEQWPAQPLRRKICNAVALVYYTGVRVGGWLFFYG
jgi:hypothetical protein